MKKMKKILFKRKAKIFYRESNKNKNYKNLVKMQRKTFFLEMKMVTLLKNHIRIINSKHKYKYSKCQEKNNNNYTGNNY